MRAFDRVVGLDAVPSGAPPADAGGRPFAAYVVARGWSALLSTVTVAVTGLVGARLAGPATGLVAAALLAASPVAVRDAHFAKADSACTLAAALVLLSLTGRGPRVVARGLAAGLAASVKYHLGPLVAVALALVTADAPRVRTRLARLVAAALVAGAVALALNAFWLWTPAEARRHLAFLVNSQYQYVHYPWFADFAPRPLAYHAGVSLRYGCGLAMALLALPALATALWRGGAARLIAIAILGQWLVLAQNPLTLGRNFLPSIPGLAVLVADLVTGTLAAVLPGRARLRAAVVVLATVVLVAEPLATSIRMVALLGQTDTRALAYRWLTKHAQVGTAITVYGAPPGAPQYGFPIGAIHPREKVAPTDLAGLLRQRSRAFVVWHTYPLPYSSAPLPPAARGLEPMVVFDPRSGPTDDPVFERFDAFYLPLARFSGFVRPGPRIEIRAAGD